MELGAQNGPNNMAVITHMAVTTNLCAITRRPVTSISGQRVQPEQTSSVVLAGLLHTASHPQGLSLQFCCYSG